MSKVSRSCILIPFPAEKLGAGVRERKGEAFIVLSFGPSEQQSGTLAIPNVSFLWRGPEIAAEWLPPYGPIQTWVRTEGPAREGVREHWAYPFVQDNPLAWSQLAVEREELPQSALSGDYTYVFGALSRWCRDDEAPIP